MRRVFSILILASVLIVSIGIFILTGCTPQWLPDSQHFVYIRADGKVMLFDVKTETEKLLGIAGSSGFTIKPAVSPDGKQIAYCRFAGKITQDKQFDFKLVITDLNGRQQHISPKEVIKSPDKDGVPTPAGACYWSPDGTRLLIATPWARSILTYHIAKRSFYRLENVVSPTTAPVLRFTSMHVSPITPDGKGFLAIAVPKHPSPEPSKYRMRLYGWESDEYTKIEIPAELLKAAESLRPEKIAVLPPQWKSGKLHYAIGPFEFFVDPALPRISFTEGMKMLGLQKHAKEQNVMVMYAFENGNLIQQDQKKNEVQLWLAREEKAKSLGKTDAKAGTASVIPAPDGKSVLLYLQAEQRRFLVLDGTGKTIASVVDKSPFRPGNR